MDKQPELPRSYWTGRIAAVAADLGRSRAAGGAADAEALANYLAWLRRKESLADE